MTTRRLLRVAEFLSPILAVAAVANAQSVAPVTVNYEAAPLHRVVENFAAFSGRTIEAAPGVAGRSITGSVQSLAWESALDRVLAQNELVARPTAAGTLRIEREQPVTVVYQDARLADVVAAIAGFAGQSIAVPPTVADSAVTVSLAKVDWQRALTEILTPLGLVARPYATGGLAIEPR
jgi:type II secretory pathway component GspD/PulD (secretin)